MNHPWQSMFRQILFLLVFCVVFSGTMHPSVAVADEPSVEEMIGALSKNNAAEPTASAPRSRGIGGKKPTTAPGQLQLSVQFESGSASISAASRGLLKKLGTAMNSTALAGQRFRIEGHTDATGDPAINLRLSTRRAKSVQESLEKNSGVASARLSAVGKGSSEPIDAADPRAAVNRRVVISVEDSAVSTQVRAPAGVVKQVRGEASLIRRNSSARIVEGDLLRQGDTITTTVGTSVMLQLSDDAKLLVRPASKVRLTQITNTGPAAKRSQAIELAVGALRYVTGALGKFRPQAVRFKTPNATIGIRGTDIDIVHTPATRGQGATGTFVRVNSGEVELNGSDGSQLTLSINEQGLASQVGPRTRGGGRTPAVTRQAAPVGVFVTGELDFLLD